MRRARETMRKIVVVSLLAICSFCFISGESRADDFHYTNLLIGDRASGMGGAYIAISDDATGLYYNPAGIAYTSVRNLSASVNAFYNNDKKYKSVIGGNGWNRHSSALLPNFFGVVQPVGKYKIGLSYAVPDSSMEDQSQVFNNLQFSNDPLNNIRAANPGVNIASYIVNFNNENNVYEFGPSIAVEINDKVSAGLTLYYYQRKNITILNQLIRTSTSASVPTPGFELSNFNAHIDESGIRPILGIMWSPASNISIGATLSRVTLWHSSTSIQSTYVREGIVYPSDRACDGTPVVNQSNKSCIPGGSATSNNKREFPTQLGLGVAWFPSPSLLLSADLNHFSKVASENIESVTNLAVGTEYFLNKNWAVRGGAYTNMANTPLLQEGLRNQSEHIDMFGVTGSISNFTRNSSVTLGGSLTYGRGNAQIIGNSTAIQDVENTGWMIFLSSSYSY